MIKSNASVLLAIATALSLFAQPTIEDWRARRMEIPGLTLSISNEKPTIQKGDIVQLSASLQYSGDQKLLISKAKSTEKLWLFHIDVAAPMPHWIPLAPKAPPTVGGKRRMDVAEGFGSVTKLLQIGRIYTGNFDLNNLYEMQQPGDYKVTVWCWIGVSKGLGVRDAQWVTIGSNELTIRVVP